MPLQATSGAASYDAFGGGVPVVPNYIEDVFSCFLYTGNATTGQSINNGIDLATKGGLLWCKNRTTGSTPHYLFDTARDFSYSNAAVLNTASTAAQEDKGTDYAKPETNGFSFGSGAGTTSPNKNGDAFVSWTFRKQPKFFDIVTWTGDGTGNRSIPHLLGSTPAFIQTKLTSGADAWWNHHRSVTSPNANWWRNYGLLDGTQAFADWGDDSGLYQSPDATNLYIGSYYNGSGKTYVAYLFAHNAGGFGLTGTDNVISCGSFTGGDTVNLGYEPQFVLYKPSAVSANWRIVDNMRGMFQVGDASPVLFPNLSNAEATHDLVYPNATGFTSGANGTAYIYIAIRRGPMKVPTTGTSVFAPATHTGTGTAISLTSAGFPPDLFWSANRDTIRNRSSHDRLRGIGLLLLNSTNAEDTGYTNSLTSFNMTGISVGTDSSAQTINNSAKTYAHYYFRRAPSFFDEVCYTGTGSAMTISHNLGTAPQLVILKERNAAGGWIVYSSPTGFSVGGNLAGTGAFSGGLAYVSATSSTTFTTITNATTWVAYLFATCAGVSKVGSYTGTGTTLQIDCGFTAGARFVLIKRTDSTGDWYVWDTARGIVSGNDPYLLLNTTDAEVTNTDYIDTYSAGFEISSTAPAAINASGGSFIFFAVA
jgi:hypothetical protein